MSVRKIYESKRLPLIDAVDYNYAKTAKIHNAYELMIWLGLGEHFNGSEGRLGNYVFRICGQYDHIIDVSCISDFDKWSNSSLFEFQLHRKSEQRQFVEFIKELKDNIMQIYSFIISLSNVSYNETFENKIHQSGCDDALICFSNDEDLTLEFDREAESLNQAIMSAIQDINNSNTGAIVTKVEMNEPL
jgi:hypothetical protein